MVQYLVEEQKRQKAFIGNEQPCDDYTDPMDGEDPFILSLSLPVAPFSFISQHVFDKNN